MKTATQSQFKLEKAEESDKQNQGEIVALYQGALTRSAEQVY